jgi:tRNA(adenine34) deaminase
MNHAADIVMKSADSYMREALEEAKLAYQENEVPIGAVLVCNGEIVARNHNRKEATNDATSHAELLCIQEASQKLGSWHLGDCVLYTTVEPCAMCSGAIINARIPTVIYAAPGIKFGTHLSVVNILDSKKFNHNVDVTGGVLEEESANLLKAFFQERR